MKTAYIVQGRFSSIKIYGLTFLERAVIAAIKSNPKQVIILAKRLSHKLHNQLSWIFNKYPHISFEIRGQKTKVKTPVSATFFTDKVYRGTTPIYALVAPLNIRQTREALFQSQAIPRFPPTEFSQHFFSYAGKTLLPLFFYFNFSANQVTYLSVLLAIVAAYLMGVGEPGLFLIGSLVAILSKVLDYVDGRIARLRHQVTNFGVLLDPLADRCIWILLVLGSTFGVLHMYDSLLTAFLYIFPNLVFGFSQLLYILTKKKQTSVPLHISYLLSYFSQAVYLFVSALTRSYLLISLLTLPLALIHLIYSLHNFYTTHHQ